MEDKTSFDCYCDGLEAAHIGKSAADCPYDYTTREGKEWIMGYEDGGGLD